MSIFHVPLKKQINNSYDIEIGSNLFHKLVDDLKKGLIKGTSKYAIITDTNVENLYGKQLHKLLLDNGFKSHLFVFKAGEKSKTRPVKARLEDQMIAKLYGRDSCVIALGGGVVTDLAGFLAGTFARGIPFINYATTLLAAADASIGGKTAVDTAQATNLIGLFYQPRKVYIDIQTWKTLTTPEIRCGLAETIKHACMADEDFFTYLEQNMERIITRDNQIILDQKVCEYIAHKNCAIKYEIVKKDERENNLRQVLNLGHTIGRALEPLSHYRLLHGQAVSIGLAFQTRLGLRYGYLTKAESQRVINLLQSACLPITIPDYVSSKALVNKLYTDKKVRKNKIRFVFQRGIGHMMCFEDNSYSRDVEEKDILAVL